jgi:hypothetical protein
MFFMSRVEEIRICRDAKSNALEHPASAHAKTSIIPFAVALCGRI